MYIYFTEEQSLKSQVCSLTYRLFKHGCDLSQLNFFHKRKMHILGIRNTEGHFFFESYVSRWKGK